MPLASSDLSNLLFFSDRVSPCSSDSLYYPDRAPLDSAPHPRAGMADMCHHTQIWHYQFKLPIMHLLKPGN